MTKNLDKILNWTKGLLNIIVSTYMVLIIAIMPFYFTEGYGRIGTNKYEFFYGATTKMGRLFLPVWGIYLVLLVWDAVKKFKEGKSMQQAELFKNPGRQLSLTDYFAIGYGVVLSFSYLNSEYREMTPYGDAWKGSNGWYMGFSTQMLFLAIYFAVSRFWKPKKWLLSIGLAAGFFVFLLGYCNRFGVYPIKMEYAGTSFISTIGNINWFCGYLVTVFFGFLYYWWSGGEEKSRPGWILTAYCIVGFGVLVIQGSNSGLMTMLIMTAVFYLMSMKQGAKMQRFWLMLILLSGTCCITMLLRYMFPDSFMLQDAVTDVCTYSIAPIVVLLICTIVYVLVANWNVHNQYPKDIFTAIGRVGIGAGAAVFVLLVLGIVMNTLIPGSLGKLSEISFLTFDENWGSHRGATYMAGIKTWLAQDLSGKLLGVGPDCMAMYIHGGSSMELQTMVQKIWGNSVMLTNAHCEWLTVLVNAGALGLICFAGMIVSAVTRFVKAGKSNVIAAACGICILAYTVNNMVSFKQAMATTTMFVILGIGEAYMRKTSSALHERG